MALFYMKATPLSFPCILTPLFFSLFLSPTTFLALFCISKGYNFIDVKSWPKVILPLSLSHT